MEQAKSGKAEALQLKAEYEIERHFDMNNCWTRLPTK